MQVNLLDIVFALLNFLILLGILQLVLYKPVVRLLNEREERVKRQNQELEANRQKLAALEEELERKQTELAAQVRQILDDARHQGQKTKEEILAQAREGSPAHPVPRRSGGAAGTVARLGGTLG